MTGPDSGGEAREWLTCRHPFGCQAPGEGCSGRCPVSSTEAREIEQQAFPIPASTVPDNAGLREALALWLETRGEPIRYEEPARHWLPVADAFIAKHIAPLLAERDEAVAKVAAARELAAELRTTPIAGQRGQDYRQGCIDSLSYASDRIRRALGDPT